MEVPKHYFLVKGKGEGISKLVSFEMALRDAGIHPFNLVKVSSIMPPNCIQITKEEGIKLLKEGAIVYTVLAVNSSNEKGKTIGAGVGLAIPSDGSFGYFSEYESENENEEETSKKAENLARIMLSSLKGEKLVKDSLGIAECAKVSDQWTSVIAAAVFV
ncbi:MAG: arginine decarboxylase, pyruvoyl-dependent [Candidatus Rehaiarchaeum fermentans]|nr:arginine decarboxylase, pyruvoyl-dependent [Candidatus Rehaiarchaeum fermentans]MCW1302326.1 arginine decarboxylase, pyruvoyl-dependent [Candidatus Rehaiarchaeum fermentans]